MTGGTLVCMFVCVLRGGSPPFPVGNMPYQEHVVDTPRWLPAHLKWYLLTKPHGVMSANRQHYKWLLLVIHVLYDQKYVICSWYRSVLRL